MRGMGWHRGIRGSVDGDLDSADTTVDTKSIGIDTYRRGWHRAAYAKVQRVYVGLRGDVDRCWRNALTPAVGVQKCEVGKNQRNSDF